MISYIITTNLAYIMKYKSDKKIQYKTETIHNNLNENTFNNFQDTKEKTLIERDINDPSPTMNAQFRVIGKYEKYSKNYIDEKSNQDRNLYDSEESYTNHNEYNENDSQGKQDSNDWNDDSFRNW